MSQTDPQIVVSAPTGGGVLYLVNEGIGVPVPINIASTAEADVPYDIELTLNIDEHGVVVCERIEARRRPNGAAITNEGLRSVPIRQWTDRAVAEVSLHAEVEDDGRLHLRSSSDRPDPGQDAVAPAKRGAPRSPAANRITDEYLREVARIYRSATRAPTNAVHEQMNVSRSHAGRLVSLARERGFLKPAPGRGRSGEA